MTFMHILRAVSARTAASPAFFSTLTLLIAFGLVLSSAVGPAVADQWQGQEVEKEGVTHVMNPAAPAESPSTSEARELWRLGGDTDDDDEFFGVISTILTDDEGNVYLLDGQLNHVMIYSPTGDFMREIGREGEGPGEFRSATGMFFTPEGDVAVIQSFPGKIVILTREGDPIGDYPLPEPEGAGFFVLVNGQSYGSNVVLQGGVMSMNEQRWQQERYLASVDKTGTEVAKYHSDTRVIDFANPIMDDRAWDTFDRRWTVGSDGRVYAATVYQDYAISVWNADGTMNRVIEREYTHRKRTTDEMQIMENMMGVFAKRIPNCTVKITEWTKDIETMYVHDDGTMWVLTSDGSRDLPDGSLGVFDIFDPQGRFVRQVTIMGEGNPMRDGYYFVGDRLYVVTDLVQASISLQAQGETIDLGGEEPEPMSVICYQMDEELITSR
ncbi:MAG: 6-bladed beta-propeller [bacterium]|nr:6-bladed beta-propeller [bacterium]